MLHIYYGFGKGKTSTLNGSAIRLLGANFKVAIFRFLKGRETSEDHILIKVGIPVEKIHLTSKFVFQMTENEKIQLQEYDKKKMSEIIKNKDLYDFYCFDEIIDLVETKIISLNELMNFLDQFKDKEVLISGHYKYEPLFEKADLITYFNPEKHYFDKGVQARKGVEF